MPPSLTLSAESERLPIGALLALAMTGFICIVTETLPAGLLPLISEGMAISPSMAGQMVTAYALGSVLAVIPMTIATRGWRRRNVLLLTIVGFLLFNSITALSSHYGITLVARFFAGVAAGLAWSLLAGYARRMVAPHQQGRALALAMVGTPIALSLGVPLGTWLGGLVGWRTTFGLMSGLTLVLIVWVLVKVPDYAPQPAHQRLSLGKVLTTPGVRPVLGGDQLDAGAQHSVHLHRTVRGASGVGESRRPGAAGVRHRRVGGDLDHGQAGRAFAAQDRTAEPGDVCAGQCGVRLAGD